MKLGVVWLAALAISLAACEELPPCGLISVNSTVHCHDNHPGSPEKDQQVPPPTPIYPYSPHQRG